jgi:hypothetical protein
MLDMDAKKMIEQIESMIQQLHAMQLVLQSSLPSVLPSIEAEERDGICHYCKQPLGDERPIRGDHPRCYKEIMRAIAANDLTEFDACEKGWLAAPKSAGRKPNQTPIRALANEAKARKVAEDVAAYEKKKAANKKGYVDGTDES